MQEGYLMEQVIIEISLRHSSGLSETGKLLILPFSGVNLPVMSSDDVDTNPFTFFHHSRPQTSKNSVQKQIVI